MSGELPPYEAEIMLATRALWRYARWLESRIVDTLQDGTSAEDLRTLYALEKHEPAPEPPQ